MTRRLILVIALIAATGGGRSADAQSPRERRGKGSTKRGARSEAPSDAPLANFTGVVKSISSKTLTIEDADGKDIPFECSKKTAYFDGDREIKPSAVKPGVAVRVGAKIGIDGKAEAAEVHLGPEKTPPVAGKGA